MTQSNNEQFVEQRSNQWFTDRMGKFTASTFSDCMGTGKGKDAEFTLTGQSLIREKVTEILTGERKLISGDALDWGVCNEEFAISAYEKLRDVSVIESQFVLLKDYEKWAGGSPDGLIENENGIIEVKCPYVSSNHIEALIDGNIPKKSYARYYTQIQFNILATDTEFCDFVSFDPRMKNEEDKCCVIRIDRDNEYIEKILDRLDLAIIEIKKYLKDIKDRRKQFKNK